MSEYKYYLTIDGYQLTTEPQTVDQLILQHGNLVHLEHLGYRLVRDLDLISLEKRKEFTQVSGLSSDKLNISDPNYHECEHLDCAYKKR